MKTITVLTFPKAKGDLIALAQFIVDRMTDNPYFPSPTPPLPKVAARVAAAAAAQAAVLTRTKGNRAARDVILAELKVDLRRLEAYVQSVGDDNPEQALAIFASAGMGAKRPSFRTKAPLVVRHGPVPGSAELVAKAAGDRAIYEWRYSTDQETWTLAPQTIQARTVIDGLTPVTRYYFQLRITTPQRSGGWGQVVSLVVL